MRKVGADNRTDDALVDRDVVDHAVEEEHRAVQSCVPDGAAGHKCVIPLKERLHQLDIAFQIGGKRDIVHGFTPYQGYFAQRRQDYASFRSSASVWPNRRMAASASGMVLPDEPTSTSIEPGRACWLKRCVRRLTGRIRPG